MVHSLTAVSADKVRSGRVLWSEQTSTVRLATHPAVQVGSSVVRVGAPVTGAGEEPVGHDVLPPGHRAPQQAAVGDGQLAAGRDVPGGHQG